MPRRKAKKVISYSEVEDESQEEQEEVKPKRATSTKHPAKMTVPKETAKEKK